MDILSRSSLSCAGSNGYLILAGLDSAERRQRGFLPLIGWILISRLFAFCSLSLSFSRKSFRSRRTFVMSPTVDVYGHRVVSLAGVVARCSTQRISVKGTSEFHAFSPNQFLYTVSEIAHTVP